MASKTSCICRAYSGLAISRSINRSPLVWRGIVEERAGLVGRRDHPRQVETNPTEKLGVRRGSRGITVELRLDRPIDPPMKGFARRNIADDMQNQDQCPNNEAGRGKATFHGIAPLWIVPLDIAGNC